MKKILLLTPFIFLLFIIPGNTFAAEWTQIGSAEKQIVSTVIDRGNKNLIIYNDGSNTYRTENGGASWSEIIIPNVHYCLALSQDTRNGNEYWAGCLNGLYHSTDQGKTFSQINYPVFQTREVRRIVQSKEGVLYLNVAGTNYKSFEGIFWQTLKNEGNYSSLIYPDPYNPGVLYESATSYGAKGLYKSSDYGETWRKVSSYFILDNGLGSLIFYGNNKICGATNSYGYGCSYDGGITWSGFGQNGNLPQLFNYIYYAYQNPDEPENVIVYVGDVYGNDRRLYSSRPGQVGWMVEYLPKPTNNLHISQGTIFAGCFSGVAGLWKNEGIAVLPEYLKKHPVILIPGILGSWKVGNEFKIDPILGTYNSLLTSLNNVGYGLDSFLFTFPYDWRVDNRITAKLLGDKVKEVKEKTGSKKVDIVAHSMGGLVAREYAESDYYKNDIDQLIFLGTPHEGSAASYIPYESGILSFGDSLLAATVKNYIFGKEAKSSGYTGDNAVFRYIREKIVTVSQLLPVGEYLERSGNLIPFGQDYPANDFIKNLNSKKDLLKARNIRTTNIVGLISHSTISKFGIQNSSKPPLWEHGEPINFYSFFESKYIYYTAGDGTVASESSTFVGDKIVTKENVNHNNLPREGILEVEKEFNVAEPSVSPAKPVGRGLFVFVHSPVDISITSPTGKRIGSFGGTQLNDIEDAFYQNEGEIEFAYIPNPESGEYKIGAKGTDNGHYRVELNYINEDSGIKEVSNFENDIALSQDQNLVANLDTGTEKISIEPEDTTPPETLIKVNGEANNSLYSGSVEIAFEARDNESRLGKTFYSINENGINEYINSFSISEEGHYRIDYYSVDNVGNKEDMKSIFFAIDNTGPNILFTLNSKRLKRNETPLAYLGVVDALSGLNYYQVFIDGIVVLGNELSLWDYSLGKHVIRIIAFDNIGNRSLVEDQFEIYTTYKDTISDLALFYSNGSLKNKGIQISIATKLRQASHLERYFNSRHSRQFLIKAKHELQKYYKGGKISLKAYQVILDDIKYLLEG